MGVNVPVGVGVGVEVGVFVGVIVGVGVLVGVTVGVWVGVGVQTAEQVSFQLLQPLPQVFVPVPQVVTEHALQVVAPGTQTAAGWGLLFSLALGSGASAVENHLFSPVGLNGSGCKTQVLFCTESIQ